MMVERTLVLTLRHPEGAQGADIVVQLLQAHIRRIRESQAMGSRFIPLDREGMESCLDGGTLHWKAYYTQRSDLPLKETA